MTAKEKWKNEILGELRSRSISELIGGHVALPCFLLSSVERKEVTEEVIVCPYCFEKTKIEYPTLKKHTITRTCDRVLRERNFMRIMYDLEKSSDKAPEPGRSILARKANRFMDENPIDELPIDIFNKNEYLVLKLQRRIQLCLNFFVKKGIAKAFRKTSSMQLVK